jgi:hypothetical protein
VIEKTNVTVKMLFTLIPEKTFHDSMHCLKRDALVFMAALMTAVKLAQSEVAGQTATLWHPARIMFCIHPDQTIALVTQ